MANHRPSITKAAAERLDVIIIGGGINGAGVARDAALRGFRVALFEKSDFGSGTSSRSSKLIHGGIRYLEQGRLGLVFEAIHEREILQRIAPHLTRPLPFIFPVYKGSRWPLSFIHIGIFLYDLLALSRNVQAHRMLSPEEAVKTVPGLKKEGLKGAALYYDGQMDDARLTLANILDARSNGAKAWNYTPVTGLIKSESGRIRGVYVRDSLTGEEAAVRAPVVINAAGPWVDEVCELDVPGKTPKTRGTRGSHIVIPPLTDKHALVIRSGKDNRILFIIPWEGMSLVGTTDIDDSTDPGKIRCPEEDRDYLIREARRFFPGHPIKAGDVISSFAGVRPLVYSPGGHASLVSRESRITEGNSGLISITGGKYTTYRKIAEGVVNRIKRKIPEAGISGCVTKFKPLWGGDFANLNDYIEETAYDTQKRYPLDAGQVRHLAETYGTKLHEVLQVAGERPGLTERLHPQLPHLKAEAVYAAREDS
ncbi:MAG TPA: glycerol-3-phosphate dehydrogenase, partial [Nitrospiria bacterium]